MKKPLLALSAALALGVLPELALAQLAFNVGAVTDYRYRGISQTRLKPALQGGIDYSNGPFYLGAWGSTIKWVKDGGGSADVELDFYGGLKGEIVKGLGYDVGLLQYVYPDAVTPAWTAAGAKNPDTTELYGALSYSIFTAKYSHAVSNLFGFADSKNSYYVDLSAAFDLGGGYTLTPHVGYQKVKRNSAATYTDWSLGISKDIKGVLLSATLVDTDTKAYVGPNAKDLGKPTLVLGAKFGF